MKVHVQHAFTLMLESYNVLLSTTPLPAACCSQIAETDTRSLMELFADVAHADLEAESGYNLTEANLVKVWENFIWLP